ncbi:hypothetical protein KEM48_007609 [Puccinia striiformis f. sp. tritici PST-130]|nr:hypothetical protein KEM48_007609 [Puccinia striiformis f. sp. tritici PST-130]
MPPRRKKSSTATSAALETPTTTPTSTPAPKKKKPMTWEKDAIEPGFSKPGHFKQWRGKKGTGVSKEVLANEIVQELADKGIHHRIPRDIRTKITELQASFTSTCDWIRNTGQGLLAKDAANGTNNIRDIVIKRFKYYYDLEEVMGEQDNANPCDTVDLTSELVPNLLADHDPNLAKERHPDPLLLSLTGNDLELDDSETDGPPRPTPGVNGTSSPAPESGAAKAGSRSKSNSKKVSLPQGLEKAISDTYKYQYKSLTSFINCWPCGARTYLGPNWQLGSAPAGELSSACQQTTEFMSQDRHNTHTRTTPWAQDGQMATHQALISFLNGSLVMEMKVITAGLPPRVRGPSSAVRFLKCYTCMAYIIELRNFESPGRQPEFSFVMVHQKKLCYELLQAAGISLQPRQVTFKRFNVTYDFSEFPPSPTRSVEMDPDDLCCFCDEILPKNPSAAFLKANKKLQALPEVRARNKSKNPSALYLPFPQRAEHCQLHQAELATIPDGINRGWPTQIDFGAHKACGFQDKFATFQVEQPGYYGPPGYRHITQALNDLFKPSPAVQSAPL